MEKVTFGNHRPGSRSALLDTLFAAGGTEGDIASQIVSAFGGEVVTAIGKVQAHYRYLRKQHSIDVLREKGTDGVIRYRIGANPNPAPASGRTTTPAAQPANGNGNGSDRRAFDHMRERNRIRRVEAEAVNNRAEIARLLDLSRQQADEIARLSAPANRTRRNG